MSDPGAAPHWMKRAVLVLLVWCGMHCSDASQGLELRVVFGLMPERDADASPPPDGPEPGVAQTPTAVVDAEGVRIELDAAYLVVSEVALVPCAPHALRPDVGPSRGAQPLMGPGVARAHGAGSALVLAEPYALDLMHSAASPMAEAILSPPPGEYCELRVRSAPADADAVGLPDELPLEGASLYVAGHLLGSADGEGRPFQLRSTFALDVHLPLLGADGTPGLALPAPGGGTPTLHLDFHAQQLFQDSSLLLDAPDVLGFLAVDNLLRSARAHAEVDGDG